MIQPNATELLETVYTYTCPAVAHAIKPGTNPSDKSGDRL